ncbi:MAG: pyrimidine dimer DNA glycosylase/endonuclease V [Microbacteriaceae bacterium]|nr:pyrimidine dimer DNA glycosylase/endonuclease V [Microbacteriaceae bacterium]HPZ34568.1 pyrimidine dimer DNA glycosylase/endonuclease V [Microbacteriaceae bacterium]HQC93275.1 pyrimidine dimer DNA glycosylase/endonuclease V [Microbacteriaceae bacterium]
MRLWSLHPAHLDRAGLTAAWREALLAQAVLAGRTKGYRHHPQLRRFRDAPEPLAAVGAYLRGIQHEAGERGYRFDASRILVADAGAPAMPVTRGQLEFEWTHLGGKLAARSPDDAARWRRAMPTPHPLFFVVPGPVEDWERP